MPESVCYNRYQLSAKRMCTVMEKEYDPEQYRDLGQNVMTVSYGLSALYQATDEVLRAYLDSYGYSYASHFEENNVYRIQYLNQLFFYGITICRDSFTVWIDSGGMESVLSAGAEKRGYVF